MTKKKRKSFTGWTLTDLLKDLNWERGRDFRATLQIPMLVSEAHWANPKEFVKVRITITEL